MGRIPLTDAELVKALVLSRSRDLQGTDSALSVAAEWDLIERDLRDPELWAVLTAKSDGEAAHISLLLKLLADQVRAEAGLKVLSPREQPPFYVFETLRPRVVTDPEASGTTSSTCTRPCAAGSRNAAPSTRSATSPRARPWAPTKPS